jgi:hypothetical protein
MEIPEDHIITCIRSISAIHALVEPYPTDNISQLIARIKAERTLYTTEKSITAKFHNELLDVFYCTATQLVRYCHNEGSQYVALIDSIDNHIQMNRMIKTFLIQASKFIRPSMLNQEKATILKQTALFIMEELLEAIILTETYKDIKVEFVLTHIDHPRNEHSFDENIEMILFVLQHYIYPDKNILELFMHEVLYANLGKINQLTEEYFVVNNGKIGKPQWFQPPNLVRHLN